jgi:hypothetical protein
MRHVFVVPLVAWAVLTLAACSGANVDITKAVQVTDLTTGWYDAGVENGLNKLVPTIGFRLKNAMAIPLRNVQLNAVFRRIGETEEWGASYIRVIQNEGLAAGATTNEIVLRSNLGYTSTDARSQMLRHSEFRDVRVKVFAKQGSAEWTSLGEWDIPRVLIVPSYKPQSSSPKS